MTNKKNWSTRPALSWLEKILEERFGHEFQLTTHTDKTQIKLAKSDQFIDILQITNFYRNDSDMPHSNWISFKQEGWISVLKEKSIPAPATQTLHRPLIEPSGYGYTVYYDILGLTYWMLSRQEEVGRTDLDKHGRFPAVASHAYKHSYLERPIVDEWLHILGQIIQRTWPQLKLKQHQFSMMPSHDVDTPSHYAFKSWLAIARISAGHILKRRSLPLAIQSYTIKINSTQGLISTDPTNTFGWIMDNSEQHELKSAFYFICGRTQATKDADYEIEHPSIRSLMRQIHLRGHEIGLHPSYNTYQNPQTIVNEAKRLRTACKQEGIYQIQWGGRMHYLRWQHPTTLYGWEQAKMDYDSTLGYADCAGFRCGTCFEYPAFDPQAQQILNLRIRPLIAMECSIIDSSYMNLGHSQKALDKFIELKNKCKAVNGNFTLLWHNSRLISSADKNLYNNIIEA